MPRTATTAPEPRAPLRRRGSLALGIASLALAGTLAGCGSSAAPGSSADPATVIPASSPLFAEASVRPSGALKTSALAAGRALTHQSNPYLRLLGALQSPGSPQLSYTHDLAPWLGAKAGIYIDSLSAAGSLLGVLQAGLLGSSTTAAFPFSATGAQGAIVLDTTDSSKAHSFLAAQAAHAGAHSTTYKGVSYQATEKGVAFGLVHRLAVIGSEAGMHGVIDTAQGGASLAGASGYSKLLAKSPAGTLAHLYSNPTGAGSSGSGEGVPGLLRLLAGTSQANVSIVPSASSLRIDADTLSTGALSKAGLLSSDPENAKALEELPGESWLAIGLGHVGRTLTQDAQALSTLSSLGSTLGIFGGPESPTSVLSIKSLLGAMSAPLEVLGAKSAQAQHDYASWMGSAGIFASGASLLELKAAITIVSKNPALSKAAVSKLANQLYKNGGSRRPVSIPGTEAAAGVALPGLPVVLDIAAGRASDGQSRFILGFGEASVEDALSPTSTMAGAAAEGAASSALGEGTKPSLLLDFPTLLSLLEGVGLTEAPGISKFLPYVRALSTLAGGGHELGGEIQRFSLALGLQQSEG